MKNIVCLKLNVFNEHNNLVAACQTSATAASETQSTSGISCQPYRKSYDIFKISECLLHEIKFHSQLVNHLTISTYEIRNSDIR